MTVSGYQCRDVSIMEARNWKRGASCTDAPSTKTPRSTSCENVSRPCIALRDFQQPVSDFESASANTDPGLS